MMKVVIHNKVILVKLVLLFVALSLLGCYKSNETPSVACYKENDTFDRAYATTISNFWGSIAIGGIDTYNIRNRKKLAKFYKLLNGIKYQEDSNMIFPLYSLVTNYAGQKDTLYIDDTGIGYSSKRRLYFNSEDIYIFLKQENPEFFNL